MKETKIKGLKQINKTSNKGLYKLKDSVDTTKYNVLVQDKKEGKTYLIDSSQLGNDGSGGGGGSPAGSDNQIQINQSGAFFADSTFQKSTSGFNVGLDHTTQSAVTFTGSGLDDFTILANAFSGTYPTTYTVTVDGLNKDILIVSTSSISGGSFAVGNTITNGGGASATIDAISTSPSDDKTIFVISSYTGTFSTGNTIDNGSGVTATQSNNVSTQDTFTWTDGTTTVTQTIYVDSNGIFAVFPTGHTLSDSWTWTYSLGVQNILDFSNNDYKFQSTFDTDTFGYQISDNLLGYGLKGSANTFTNVAGDFGITGILNTQQPRIIDQLLFADGNSTTQSLFKNQYDIEVSNGTESSSIEMSSTSFGVHSSNGTESSSIEMSSTSFGVHSSSSSGEHGISQSAGAVSVGNLYGGNGTKITIDDVNEHITISNLQAYDDDAAAGTGGLTAGMVYMTTGSGSAPLNTPGILMIKQ